MNKQQVQCISDKIITNLRELKVSKNISHYKLAEDLGMSKSSIPSIENLKQRPSFYTVLMITNYLDINLSDVIKQLQKK